VRSLYASSVSRWCVGINTTSFDRLDSFNPRFFHPTSFWIHSGDPSGFSSLIQVL
jgi:hypothetical protein